MEDQMPVVPQNTPVTPAPAEMPAPSAASAAKRDYILPGSIILAAVMIAGSLFYTAAMNRRAGVPSAPTPVAGNQPAAPIVASGDAAKVQARDVVLGEESAPVTVVEYGDYQCPFCARFFRDVEPKIREQYIKTGKVKMVYRNFTFLGPESFAAAEAAECAKDQGKFWAFHDGLFTAELADGTEHNGNLNKALFTKIAKDVGMDTAKFAECFDSQRYADTVTKETDDARQYGVQGTPATFVNTQFISGAQPWASFEAAIKGFLGAVK